MYIRIYVYMYIRTYLLYGTAYCTVLRTSTIRYCVLVICKSSLPPPNKSRTGLTPNSWTDRLQIAFHVFFIPSIGEGEGEGESDMDLIITITFYILPIDCLLIALDAHMFSHNRYRPGSRAHIHYG